MAMKCLYKSIHTQFHVNVFEYSEQVFQSDNFQLFKVLSDNFVPRSPFEFVFCFYVKIFCKGG